MPRDTLTRDQIVRTAVELLDAQGLEGLNMRALGKRLDSAATTVYWHVKSKDNLVLLATDRVWGELTLPDLDAVGWRAAACAMASDLYGMFIRHPWLVQVLSAHVVFGEGKARHDDHQLAVYEAAGFTGAQAAQAAAAVFTYVLTAPGHRPGTGHPTNPPPGTDPGQGASAETRPWRAARNPTPNWANRLLCGSPELQESWA
ncbi:TetR/AcrR family transcriptional regulator [Spirillospora sp. CA-255316]